MLPLLGGIDDCSGSGAGGMEDVVPVLFSMKTHCCGDDSSSPSSALFFISAAARQSINV